MKPWILALGMLSILVRPAHATADEVQKPPSTCQVTEAVASAAPPASLRGLPFPNGLWYINPERTVWALVGSASNAAGVPRAIVLRSEAVRNTVLWIRPADVQLVVTGRRTDAAAPPMRATLTAAAGEYAASDVFFPTEGCWEIAAVADTSRLTFVVWVEPPAPPSELISR